MIILSSSSVHHAIASGIKQQKYFKDEDGDGDMVFL